MRGTPFLPLDPLYLPFSEKVVGYARDLFAYCAIRGYKG